MKLSIKEVKSLLETFKDPNLLSSKPHHGRDEDESIYDPNGEDCPDASYKTYQNHCFITGKELANDDKARFTWEFDAFVSEEGQRIVQESNDNDECILIANEWFKQDVEAANKEQYKLSK